MSACLPRTAGRCAPGLTLNYGVRWDLLPPWREKYNQIQTASLGQQSVVYPDAPRGLCSPAIPASRTRCRALNTQLRSTYRTRVVAEIGGARKTIVRAGYGLFYTAIEGLSAGIMSASPPYGMDFDSFGPPLFETPFVIASTGDNVGQRFPVAHPRPGASPRTIPTHRSIGHSISRHPHAGVLPDNVTPYSGRATRSRYNTRLGAIPRSAPSPSAPRHITCSFSCRRIPATRFVPASQPIRRTCARNGHLRTLR